MGNCKERWAERDFKYQDSFSGYSATFLHRYQRQVGLSLNCSGNYGWTVSKKDPVKEQLEDDPGEISCRPQIRGPTSSVQLSGTGTASMPEKRVGLMSAAYWQSLC